MKDKEKEEVQAKRNAPATETKVALDALAVYVNDEEPARTRSRSPPSPKSTSAKPRIGKTSAAKSHPIVLYGRENNSGTYGYFKEHVLGGKDFAASTQTLAGTSAVANAVKGDEFGIGYGGIAYLEGIKALKVKKDDATPAVAPSLQTAQDGSYPISRFLYFYTAGEPTGAARNSSNGSRGPKDRRSSETSGITRSPKGEPGEYLERHRCASPRVSARNLRSRAGLAEASEWRSSWCAWWRSRRSLRSSSFCSSSLVKPSLFFTSTRGPPRGDALGDGRAPHARRRGVAVHVAAGQRRPQVQHHSAGLGIAQGHVRRAA